MQEKFFSPLGNTEILVSHLCFGTLPFSPLQGYTGGPDEAGEILSSAFELGVNFIDTAQLYGNYALLRTKRDIVVASKTYAHTRGGAVEAVEEARRGLDRDVIDIFLLHEQESEHTLRGHAPALEALYDLKANGVLRAVGLSTHHVAGVYAAVEAGLDVVHPLLNVAGLGIVGGDAPLRMSGPDCRKEQTDSPLSLRAGMENAVTAAVNAGLGVYIMKILGGGNLFRRAQEALAYARRWGHSFALGMRDVAEVEAAVEFFKTGILCELKEHKPRSLHIAGWCAGCGRCVEKCPGKALFIKNGKARPNAGCVLCGYCGAACPDFCIKVI
jgi:predicted aldo/keto reductase-like oxidoreductase